MAYALGLGLGLGFTSARGAPPEDVPGNVVAPAISGDPSVGQTLTASNGTWTNSPTSYAYQWYADAVEISGATSSTYELTASEIGADITVGVVATNIIGSSTEEVSAAVGPVAESFAIATPVLTDIGSVPGDYTPSYNIDFVDAYPDGGGIGDTLLGRWGTSEAAAEALTPVEVVIDEGIFIDGDDPFPTFVTFCEAQDVSDTIYFQVKVDRDPEFSDWSTFLSWEILDGTMTAPGLTDLVDQTVSTRVWSASFTAEIADPTAQAKLTGTGPIEVNSVVTEAGTAVYVADGDTVRFGVDTSGTNTTAVDNVVTNRGVAVETFTATTEGAQTLPQEASVGLWLEAATANVKQLITNATAVADGDPVGYWSDLSPNGFDVSAAANDSTRPLYRAGGGYPYVEFDGTDDLLRRLDALNLWTSSGYTLMIAMNASPGTGKKLVAQGYSSNTNVVFGMVGSQTTTASTLAANYRDSGNSTLLSDGTALKTSALNGSDTVITVIDDGANVTGYDDGVIGSVRAYTRGSSSFPMDRFALGALLRSTASAWMAGKIHGLIIWPGVVLDSTEQADALTYLGALQGRTL